MCDKDNDTKELETLALGRIMNLEIFYSLLSLSFLFYNTQIILFS